MRCDVCVAREPLCVQRVRSKEKKGEKRKKGARRLSADSEDMADLFGKFCFRWEMPRSLLISPVDDWENCLASRSSSLSSLEARHSAAGSSSHRRSKPLPATGWRVFSFSFVSGDGKHESVMSDRHRATACVGCPRAFYYSTTASLSRCPGLTRPSVWLVGSV